MACQVAARSVSPQIPASFDARSKATQPAQRRLNADQGFGNRPPKHI
jgi:hypothetical protein